LLYWLEIAQFAARGWIALSKLGRTMNIRLLVGTVGAVAVMAGGAQAAQLITNGGFETGTFAGWTPNVEAGSGGNLYIAANNGGPSPQSGFPTQFNPAGGNFYAITDQGGAGSYSLTQSFTLASASKVTVSFQMFANDQAGVIFDNGRDYNTIPNQNAEADILVGGADPFTNAPADIVSVLYGPGADNLAGNPNPWTSYSSTLNLAAGAYQIRFAETDNQFFFQMGVDNVSVTTAGVPEPAAWAMMLVGFGGLGALARRRRTAVAA
jgi:hypothetical protein